MASKKNKIYLVQRLAWYPIHNEDYRRGMCGRHESSEGIPVRAFASKAEASKYASELTAEARRELNPFQFTYNEVVEALTGRSEAQLLLALATLGLPLPAKRSRTKWVREYIDWPRWYDELADSLTESERDAIWNLLERLELYRVVEVEVLG